jgi:hypothetical protein
MCKINNNTTLKKYIFIVFDINRMNGTYNDEFVEAMIISISKNHFITRVKKCHVNEVQY